MNSQFDLNIRVFCRLNAFTENMNAERDREGWNKITETMALHNDSCMQSAATSPENPLNVILITTNLILC
jgi:hypothetical protein